MAGYQSKHASNEPDDDETEPAAAAPAVAAPAPAVVAQATPLPAAGEARRRTVPAPVVALAVLLLQAAFIASYVGALHAPKPANIPVAVVGSEATAAQLQGQLGAASGLVSLRAEPTADAADDAIRDRRADGAYDLTTGRLTIASGRGPAVATVLTPIFGKVATANGQQFSTRDLAPLPSGDPRGLVTFYLVIGWIVGAYLLAAVLGLLGGMAATSIRSAGSRLLTLAVYAVVSGIAGAAIVETGFGYAVGNFWPLAATGALLVFAVGAATAGIEALFGLVGTALAILAFVVAGNPSAGGAWPLDVVPSPWREVGPYLPNASGLTTVRQVLFFGGHGISQPVVVLVVYAVAGAALLFTTVRRGRPLVELLGR